MSSLVIPGPPTKLGKARTECMNSYELLSDLMPMEEKNVSIIYEKIREGIGVIYKCYARAKLTKSQVRDFWK